MKDRCPGTEEPTYELAFEPRRRRRERARTAEREQAAEE